VTELDPAWIAAQRWFRAKQRPLEAVVEVERAALGGVGDLRILEVRYADGGPPDRYLVPTAAGRDPRDGDGAWRELVAAIATGAELRGRAGTFTCAPTAALDRLLPSAAIASAALHERRLGVEQSNTSVILGDRLILKLYRLLEDGETPDLELGSFLTDGGFTDTPAVAGAVHYRADGAPSAAVAMLAELVPTTGDAWAVMLEALARDARAGIAIASEIGDLTARLHAALASRPDVPGFPSRGATAGEAASWRASAERQLTGAVDATSGEDHGRLVEIAPRVRARFADTFGRAVGEARVSRIHGDYHLGQLLARTDGGFSVIDFEGEPARPLVERREPGSPLRDVAGLLRSLDYAARTTARRIGAFDAGAWLPAAREAFLGGYGDRGPDGEHLLAAFELEKACYEVRYEAANRPDWLWLPLTAVARLVSDDAFA
jgi:trehalose synthase-fused probable maltokinase